MGRQAERGADWMPTGLASRIAANCATTWDGSPLSTEEIPRGGSASLSLEQTARTQETVAAPSSGRQSMPRYPTQPMSARLPQRRTPPAEGVQDHFPPPPPQLEASAPESPGSTIRRAAGHRAGIEPNTSPLQITPPPRSSTAPRQHRAREESPHVLSQRYDFLTPPRPFTGEGSVRPYGGSTIPLSHTTSRIPLSEKSPPITHCWRPNEQSLARRSFNEIAQCPSLRREHDASASMIRDVNMGRQAEWGPLWTPPGLYHRGKSFNAAVTWTEQLPHTRRASTAGPMSARGPGSRPWSQVGRKAVAV